MTTEEFITFSEAEFAMAFPDLIVRLIADPDDDLTFFAYMFRVPDGHENEYKLRARDLIRTKLLQHPEWCVIPSVKNMSVTREHYPKYSQTLDPMDEIISNEEVMSLVKTYIPKKRDTVRLLRNIDKMDTGYKQPLDITPPRSKDEDRFEIAA